MSAAKRLLSPIKYNLQTTPKKTKWLEEEKSAKEKDNYDFLFEEDDDFELAVLGAKQNTTSLDLSTWKRCIVEELSRLPRTFDLVLQVRGAEDEKDKENDLVATKCHLQGPWCQTRVEIGDLVSLQAVWDDQLGAFKVDKDHGFCVTNPDTLISGTSVVGSLFCRRKAVLQDRFRGIDADNKVMVIGSLVHELLQSVLGKSLKTYKEIDAVATALLHSRETTYTLYRSLMTLEEITLEVKKFVPNILSFVQQYVEGKEPAVLQKDTFQGRITQIQDIEENLWVPQLGLKGKVDVSVRIQRRRNGLKFDVANKTAIPLELKTGRASFSMEHKGQVILYQMMLSAVGRETQSGLLFYLREGMMREILATRNEQRDLIVLRNDLAYYLSHVSALPSTEEPLSLGADKFVQPFELPEPISHHSACGNCAYATICTTLAKTDRQLELRAGHPLLKVMSESTAHLQSEDYAYFIRWCGLLVLEEQEAKSTNYLRALWTDTPELRQQHGRALIDLQLSECVDFENSRYSHTFQLKQSDLDEIDLTLCGFSTGEYVIVSSRKRLAIAAGFIGDLTKSTISISLERNLLENYKGESFIVDKHESQSGNVFNYTNLGLLLDDSERATRLREIVVHRQQPTFSKVLPKVIANEGKEILKHLNAVQRQAVLKALTTLSFMLIKGLPGTGKTQTLVAVVRLLQLMGKSVFITSHTHSAVDNLLLRLKPYALPMLRLGSGARINPQLIDCSESHLMKECLTEADLTLKYASYNIVGVTCLGSSHSLFLQRKFDYCIVDEATQVMQTTVLRPLFFAEKFILVGDPDQLPPLIRSKEARQRGADESLFQRLDTEQAAAVLTLQYRMNKTITKLANELTYAGALQCGSEQVKMASLKFKPSPTTDSSHDKWLLRCLQTHIDQAVFLLDTSDCSERSHTYARSKHSSTCAAIELTFAEEAPTESERNEMQPAKLQKTSSSGKRLSRYTNYCEGAVIFHIVKALLASGYDPERIGIIAPYRAQVELLRKLAAQHHSFYASQSPALDFAAVEVNTVDQYQGRDKDIILYSCSKTGTPTDLTRSREAEILEDKRRLTVAITRSKHKLILIGDAACMQQYSPFRSLLMRIPSYCKLSLDDGKLGFDWQTLLDQLSRVINI